nr:zf-CCHC domain-containing protein/DUF4219 domain-containing protein/UBN2 domain-containing protein [Tanacetum cinerariifolium]
VGLDPQTKVRRMSIRFAPTGWCRIEERYHIVPFGEFNGVPVALIARFGVISKSTDRIPVSQGGCDDEEYAMAVRDFKKFFKRRGKFTRQSFDDKKNFQKVKEDKKDKDDRRCFKCGDPNLFISDCPKHSSNDQKAFVVECWSDSGDDCKKEEICLMALENNEVLSDTPYYSSSSLDKESWENDSSSLQEMLEMPKAPKDKHGLGYTDVIASSSSSKTKKSSPKNIKMPSVEPASLVPSARELANADELNRLAKVSPLRSDTIRLVQNRCAFYEIMFEDPIQHLKDFLKIVDSINLNGGTRSGRLRKLRLKKAWETIEDLDRYEEEE